MKFSIITINYNNHKGLRRTINSVINQTFRDFEFIIIDGGSDDGSVDVIKDYCDHITYWVSEHDKGIYNAMNKGIIQAHGTYINFMNSGDEFYSKKVFTTILPTRTSMVSFFMWTLPHQSSFIRRSLFEASRYDETLRIVADWKFYLEKIVYEGKRVQLLNLLVSNREQEGVSNSQASITIEERHKVLSTLLPPGIYQDYETLSKLDRSTLYKLLNLIDQDKTRKWITYFIKVLNRLFPTKSFI